MTESKEARNKALVLKAFDTLFNKRDYAAAEHLWSPKYIQHSAHIEPGRDGLMNLIKSLPPTLKYEVGAIVADGDFVISARKILGLRAAAELDRCRRRTHREWHPCRALGRDPGRG